MPAWTNKSHKVENDILKGPDCITCEYPETCPNEDDGFVTGRTQQFCPQYWDKVVNECLAKTLDPPLSDKDKGDVISWVQFYEKIKRKNQFSKMFKECSIEPECPSPRQYDWKSLSAGITIPYNRIENVKPKLSIWKRFTKWLHTWAYDDGTFYPDK